MARIELDGVSRDVAGTRILDRVGFTVADGEFVTLIGRSGAGKTSVLRAIAGLDPLAAGVVRFDDRDITETPTRDRDLAMISQQNTLFPTHRVRANLLFPLQNRAVRHAEARKRVEAEARAQHIEHLLERWPKSLSGGEQQLAQIARALVRVPTVFLMDEPFANLDARVRVRLRREIVELQRGYGVTTIYASNRPDEIMSMPDRLVALDGGRVIQIGTPPEVRRRPATLSLAELTGEISRLAVTVEAGAGGFWLTGDGVRLRAWAPVLAESVGRPCTLAVRSEDVHLAASGPITAVAGAITFADAQPAIRLTCGAGSLLSHQTDIAPGTSVFIGLDRWLLYDELGRLVVAVPS